MSAVYKLVFAGPVGAGKTTAVQTLSDIEVVKTESDASDEVRRLKRTTTVAMDYGLMKLGNGDQIHLYGTPGQKRFDFMWEIITENALGLVLLIKGSAKDPLADLRTYVGEFRDFIDRTGLVVGITHADATDWQVRQQICDELVQLGLPPYAMDVDPRARSNIATLVKTLIHGMEPVAESAAG